MILFDTDGEGALNIILSEEDQLEPEQSIPAIVVHHPQTKYFSVRSPASPGKLKEPSIRASR